MDYLFGVLIFVLVFVAFAFFALGLDFLGLFLPLFLWFLLFMIWRACLCA